MSDTKKPATKLRIHLLVQCENGPIYSGRAEGAMPVGQKARWIIACDPNLLMDGNLNCGTGEPWGVRCDACKATEAFKAIDRPKPSKHGESMTADGSDGCC